jgi:hypothetical protein
MTYSLSQTDPSTSKPVATHLRAALAVLLVIGLTGCSRETNQLRIKSFQSQGLPETLSETFDEAVFSHDAHGNLDLVFRSIRPSRQDPSQTIRQVVHFRAFWKPIPGRTFVESTQCNATVCYMIGTGPVCISYDGAGFMTFAFGWFKRSLKGKIESGELAPLRRVGKPKDLLGRAQITGKFRARRDKVQVLKILGELRRELGPMPSYTRDPEQARPR